MKKKTTPTTDSPNNVDTNNTSSAAQRKRLLARLRQGPIDTLAARKELNILAPAARIKELKAMGHSIITTRITLADDYSRSHHGIARYVLLQEGAQHHGN